MKISILGSLLFSGNADSEKLLEEMERAKYDAEMKAAAEEEITKSQQQSTQVQEKIGIEKRIREGKDDKVFKVKIQMIFYRNRIIVKVFCLYFKFFESHVYIFGIFV